METLGIISLFIIMLAAPCIIAWRSSGKEASDNGPFGEAHDDGIYEEDEVPEPDQHLPEIARTHPTVISTLPIERPLTRTELALRAESDARTAQELAHEAHYAALTAAAHAARLRADAAIEAAYLAEQAIRETPLTFENQYLIPQLSAPGAKTKQAA